MSRVQTPPLRAFLAAFISIAAALIMLPTAANAASARFDHFIYDEIDSSTSSPDSATVGQAQARRPEPYIIGGNETTFDKHPWLVQITLNGKAFCGGVLVHPMVVLTAAHCLRKHRDQYGPAGWWHEIGLMQAFTGRTLSEMGGEQLQLQSVWVTSNYQGLANDWGFLTLSSPSSRPTLKIAGPDEGATWRAGRTALVAGFGNIVEGGNPSPVLKEISLPVHSDSFCGSSNSYGTVYNPAVMLCAGILAGGAGTCQGDSGGPLTVPIDGGGRRIVGLVSWAGGCAKPNLPTVFTRVAAAAVSAEINNLVKKASQDFNFPGIYASPNVVGSGAKPAGCGAAQSAAAQAQAGLTSANKALKKAKQAVKQANNAVKKARRKSAQVRQKANKRAKIAKTKLKGANKTAKAAKRKAASATTTASSACN